MSYIPDNKHFFKRARNIRNELLNRTDKYLLNDYPITQEQKEIIINYRQQLRQFINNNQEKLLNGDQVELPKQPEFFNLNVLY
jgi:hypothetical protein